MTECVVHLRRCICIVEHDEDRTDTRRSEEDRNILFAIASHNTNAIALLNAHSQQAPSNTVALIVQVGIGPSRSGPWEYQTFVVAVFQTLKGQELA